MVLNNSPISSLSAFDWQSLPGSVDLVGAYIRLSGTYYEQSHTLQHVNGDRAFAAYVYGLGSTCGFAYPIGYCLDDIRVRTVCERLVRVPTILEYVQFRMCILMD